MSLSLPKKLIISILFIFTSVSTVAIAQIKSVTEAAYFTLSHTPLRLVSIGDASLAVRYKEGTGIPLFFIHGSWDDHHSWLPVAEEVIKSSSNPVILYDRRGHSASTPDQTQGTISTDVQDALALLRALGFEKAHFIGHSYGANITIELATNHPDYVESIVIYEPPIFGLLKGKTQYESALQEVQTEMQKSKQLLEAGRIEEGTFNFIENVAFGKGSWSTVFDDRARSTMTASYSTWLDQSNDPERLNIKPGNLIAFKGKITLLMGRNSILAYPAVAKELKDIVPAIHLQPIDGAGHGGLLSHTEQTATLIVEHLTSYK